MPVFHGGNDELDSLTAGDAIMPKKKILIVDDERDFVLVLSVHLKANGYNVISASDADEAITAVQTGKPDLIIMDVSMPGDDGLTVLMQLNASAHTSSVPVIMVTGLDPKARAEAFANGAVEFFIKPVNMDILLECIREQFAKVVKVGQDC
jgi:DNA-binding response OmpR family regulator